MKVSFHRFARAELLDGVKFYEEKAPGLGTSFLNQVEEGIQRISSHPKSAPVIMEPLRKLVLPTFPYNIIYHHGPHGIRIVAIAHQRREPKYWIKR